MDSPFDCLFVPDNNSRDTAVTGALIGFTPELLQRFAVTVHAMFVANLTRATLRAPCYLVRELPPTVAAGRAADTLSPAVASPLSRVESLWCMDRSAHGVRECELDIRPMGWTWRALDVDNATQRTGVTRPFPDLPAVKTPSRAPVRVAVEMEGRIIRAVYSDRPAEVAMVEYDVEGFEDDDLVQIPRADGTTEPALVSRHGGVDAGVVDAVFAARPSR